MCRYVERAEENEFIIGTETGIIHRMKKENPDKNFYPATAMATCPNMKKITLEKILWSLIDLEEEIKVEEGIRQKAKKAIDRMLQTV